MGGGLDQFTAMQDKFKPTDLDVILGKAKAGESKFGSQFDRLNMDPGRRAAMTEEMRSSAPELLGISERGATAVGRGYYSDERMKERENRIKGKQQAAMLSPFVTGAQLAGVNQPQRMAQNSVMGAMQGSPPPPPPPIFTRYY